MDIEGDTTQTSVLSIDSNRLKVAVLENMIPNAFAEAYIGVARRDMQMEPNRSVRIRAHIQGDSTVSTGVLAIQNPTGTIYSAETDINGEATLLLETGSMGEVTVLLLGVAETENALLYVDSLEIEYIDRFAPLVIAEDQFTIGIEGWRSSFLEMDDYAMGNVSAYDSMMLMTPRRIDETQYNAITMKHVDLKAGVPNTIQLHVSSISGEEVGFNMAIFSESTVNNSEGMLLPLIDQEEHLYSDENIRLRDTVISWTFTPTMNTGVLALILSSDYSSIPTLVDDIEISYLRHVNRDTLWHEHFTTDSTLLSWRSSFRPDTAQKVNVALAQISHDTTDGGRLKVALVTNPLADDNNTLAAIGIDHNNLQTGKRYLLSFRADTMNLPENYRTLMVGYYTDSVYAMGIPVTPTLLDSNITYSGDTVKIAFTAPASSLRILLIANGPENGEGYYYLDDYSLREGWVTRMNCDPNNLADNPDGRKYRFGFNGMEADDETSDDGNAYTTFFRWYDSRLGRWKSVDPKSASSPFHSSYQAMSNNPLLMVDPLGDKEYKNMNSYTKETGLDKLGKYDWLRKDRIKRTSTWDNAMAHITRDKKSGELAPFAQVRDYYIWAHQKNQERGHESRWALGALYLVNDLADAYDEGLITTGTWFASNGLTDLLGELNMKIANYAITQFHRLLYGDLSHSPLKGVDAYNFDVNFVLQEQKEIALPVYLKYTGTNALNQLNSIFNGTGFLGFGSDFISIHMPSSMGMLNSNLLSKTDNFGVAARIHIPLFMLYPDTHKSGSLYGGSSQMDEIMKTGSSKGYNPMYASFRFVNQLIMRKKWK